MFGDGMIKVIVEVYKGDISNHFLGTTTAFANDVSHR